MRFLVDESCDAAVARALISGGYEVKTVVSVARGAEDEVVLDLASREQRILVTEDKDFGELAFVSKRRAVGIILVRYPFAARQSLPQAIVELLRERPQEIPGALVVLEPSRARITRLP